MLRFDKVTCLLLLFKFTLSLKLSDSLWRSDVFLFSGYINIVSILFYNFTESIILLYTFLVNFFARYKTYMIWRISFSKFLDVLPAFTCTNTIDNLLISICLSVNILRLEWKKSEEPALLVLLIGNILFAKASRSLFTIKKCI